MDTSTKELHLLLSWSRHGEERLEAEHSSDTYRHAVTDITKRRQWKEATREEENKEWVKVETNPTRHNSTLKHTWRKNRKRTPKNEKQQKKNCWLIPLIQMRGSCCGNIGWAILIKGLVKLVTEFDQKTLKCASFFFWTYQKLGQTETSLSP